MDEGAAFTVSRNLQIFRVFGFNLASDFPFKNQLIPASDCEPDLTFTCVTNNPVPGITGKIEPAYVSPYQLEDGQSTAYFYRFEDYDLLRITDVADFYMWSDEIICHLLSAVAAYHIERRFLGSVLALWLERRGIPTLHASAVEVSGRAAVFISESRSGKSGLAAALVQNGSLLLTDDTLAITQDTGVFFGQPSYSTMRMWPDQAQFFFAAEFDSLERVSPDQEKRRIPLGPGGLGGFCIYPVPLGCVYIPQRRDPRKFGTGIEIERIPDVDAVIEMVRYSFAAAVGELGWQPKRLELFAQLVQQVPVYSLLYPHGFEYFSTLTERIMDHVSKDISRDG